ncbi:6811_t:CDS:2 [Gigaspora margarita]|uniref:6811_t:CDS:1 n=1 Tax=Gigaspora margarita TaxID=4874 RepID=A0ABM8VWI2_GIGMA|nr:6811_t:CDS:2 [Gigaspora margarita]
MAGVLTTRDLSAVEMSGKRLKNKKQKTNTTSMAPKISAILVSKNDDNHMPSVTYSETTVSVITRQQQGLTSIEQDYVLWLTEDWDNLGRTIPDLERENDIEMKMRIDDGIVSLDIVQEEVLEVNLTVPITTKKQLTIATQALRLFYFFHQLLANWLELRKNGKETRMKKPNIPNWNNLAIPIMEYNDYNMLKEKLTDIFLNNMDTTYKQCQKEDIQMNDTDAQNSANWVNLLALHNISAPTWKHNSALSQIDHIWCLPKMALDLIPPELTSFVNITNSDYMILERHSRKRCRQIYNYAKMSAENWQRFWEDLKKNMEGGKSEATKDESNIASIEIHTEEELNRN